MSFPNTTPISNPCRSFPRVVSIYIAFYGDSHVDSLEFFGKYHAKSDWDMDNKFDWDEVCVEYYDGIVQKCMMIMVYAYKRA